MGGILRVLVVGALAYAGLVLVLRVTGRGTHSKVNGFDLLVTVALGSALASTMLTASLPLAEGLAGMAFLVVLQLAVTGLSVRSDRVEALVKAEPAILMHRGRWRPGGLRRERATTEEVLAAPRSQAEKAGGGALSLPGPGRPDGAP